MSTPEDRFLPSEFADRLAAAEAIRELNDALVAHDRDAAGLRNLADLATREAAELRLGPLRDREALARASVQQHGSITGHDGDTGFEDRAVAGRANPTAIDIRIENDDSGVVATLVLPATCGGPPGRAHGGIICAVFDDVTGFAVGQLRQPAFTGELTVRYLAPVPLGEQLTIRARFEGRERRKVYIAEELFVGETVAATCRATCITAASSSPASDPHSPA